MKKSWFYVSVYELIRCFFKWILKVGSDGESWIVVGNLFQMIGPDTLIILAPYLAKFDPLVKIVFVDATVPVAKWWSRLMIVVEVVAWLCIELLKVNQDEKIAGLWPNNVKKINLEIFKINTSLIFRIFSFLNSGSDAAHNLAPNHHLMHSN